VCQVCRRKYTPEPKAQGYAEAVRRQAIELYVDGMNLRRIGRTLGLSHQTVSNWVNAHADQLPETPPLPRGDGKVSELDELFTFVGNKKTLPTS
jgi:transposase-like protein